MTTPICKTQEVIKVYEKLSGSNLDAPVVQVLSPLPPEGDVSGKAFGVIKAVQEYSNLPIDVFRTSALGNNLHAYVKIRKDGARIAYSSSLNLCWSRFFMCKEVSHIFLSDDDNRTYLESDIIDLIGDLLSGSPVNRTSANFVESIAYLTAIELLVPRQLHNIVRDMKEQGCSNLQIAKTFKTPEFIIEYRFENEKIINFFNDAYEEC